MSACGPVHSLSCDGGAHVGESRRKTIDENAAILSSVEFQTMQSVVLLLVAIALVPTAIWGRKVVDYTVTTDMPTFNADPSHDNW